MLATEMVDRVPDFDWPVASVDLVRVVQQAPKEKKSIEICNNFIFMKCNLPYYMDWCHFGLNLSRDIHWLRLVVRLSDALDIRAVVCQISCRIYCGPERNQMNDLLNVWFRLPLPPLPTLYSPSDEVVFSFQPKPKRRKHREKEKNENKNKTHIVWAISTRSIKRQIFTLYNKIKPNSKFDWTNWLHEI